MPIHVITGQPGNGKTLRMMELLEAALNEKKRPVYVHGVEGVLPARANKLVDVRDWEKCEDGSIIFVDEAWMGFGHLQDARGAPTPIHVQALATHRHRGMDFVMTTQMVNQLYPFMRGLIGEHTHVSRKFGTSLCTLYTWGEVCEDTKSVAQREKSVSTAWIQPSRLFGAFNSATQHTIKRRIPWRILAIPACAFGALFVGYLGYKSLYGMKHTDQASVTKAESGVAAPANPGADGGKDRLPSTPEGWGKALTPTVAGLAYTAPLFAGTLHVQTYPRTICYLAGHKFSDETDCKCVSEQATPLDVSEGQCRAIAAHDYYDPFRAPASGLAAYTAADAKPGPLADAPIAVAGLAPAAGASP